MLITRRPAKCIFRRNPLKNALLIAGLAAALVPASAWAQTTSTWTSSSDTNWGSPANWNNGVPLSSASFRASLVSTSGTANPNIATSATTGNLTINGRFTLSASPSQSLTLTGTGAAADATAALVTTGTNTISAPLIFGGNGIQTVRNNSTNGGPLTLSGNITKSDSAALQFSAGGTITVSGNMSVAGKVVSLANNPILSGSNSVGSWELQAGGFTLNSANALGSSGAINFGSGVGFLTFSSSNTTDYSSRFTVSANQNYRINPDGQTVTLATALAGNGSSGLVVGTSQSSTSSNLILTNSNNSFAGSVTIHGSILTVAGIGMAGSNSHLGTSGTINFGSPNSVAGTPTLVYTGNGETTNKVINLTGNGSVGATIRADNASGLLKFTSNLISSTATGVKTLTLSGSGAGEFAGAIANYTGAGGPLATALTKSGVGTWTLSGNNTYTGETRVSGGTLALTGAGSIASTGAVNVNASGATFDISGITASGLTIGSLAGSTGSVVTLGSKTLTVGDATSTTFSGTIGGTGGLTKVGAGTLTLGSNSGFNGNSFTGDTLISSGTLVTAQFQALQFSGLDTSGAGVLDAGGPTRGGLNFGGLIGSKNLTNVIVNTGSAFAAITLNSQAGRSYAYSGNIVDINAGTTMELRKNGVGTQILSGSNSYTGATEVNAGVLRLDSVNAIPGGIGSTGAGGNLKFNGGVIGLGAGDFTRALGTGTNTNQVSFTAAGAGGGFAAYGDNRVVNLGGASATATWNNGSFVPTNGALILGAADATHMVDFQNPIALGNAVRTVQVNRGSAAVDGRLSGALTSSGSNGGLTKTGAGVLELTAVNTYSGTTAINAGRFLVSGAGNLSNTARVVVNGSDADFRWNSSTAFTRPLTMTQGTISGTGTISANGGVTIGTNAILSPGNSPGIQAYTTGLTWAGGGSYIWEINDWTGAAGTAYDQLAVSGSALDITATSGSPFTILITSLTGANAAGNVPNFNDNVSKTFTIATSSVPISGFDASKFTLNTSSFSNTYSGSWSLSATGSTVLLNYTAPVTTTTGSYSLSAAAGAATIIAGGSSTITATITNTGAGTADAINYSSLGVGNGVTISPSSGSNLAQAASGTGTGVFTSVTPGLYTFDPTASVTNSSLGGAAVLSGSTATSVTVLDHATSSLSSSLTPLLSSTISLGTWDYQSQAWTLGTGTGSFSIFNLNPNSLDPSLVALLNLTGTSAIGDTGFTLDAGLNPGSFAMIAGGTSAAYSVSFDPSGLNSNGTYTRTFTFQMADQNLPGGQATNTLTLTAVVLAVPEPGSLALAGIGIAAAAFALRSRSPSRKRVG